MVAMRVRRKTAASVYSAYGRVIAEGRDGASSAKLTWSSPTTYGSRTTAVGGIAVLNAARKVREKARKIAAHLLEAGEEDVEWRDGKFQVKGTPSRSKSFAEVALMAHT